MTIEEASPIDAFVGQIVGLPAWNVKQGYGSFLTLDFGQPRLVVHERQTTDGGLSRDAYVKGAWHLWIYCCRWRVFQNRKELARCEDTREAIDRATSTLDGQKLLSLSVDPAGGRSTFTFDLGGIIDTWPYGDDPTQEQWIILSSSEAFVFRANGSYSRHPSNTPPEKVEWLPLD